MAYDEPTWPTANVAHANLLGHCVAFLNRISWLIPTTLCVCKHTILMAMLLVCEWFLIKRCQPIYTLLWDEHSHQELCCRFWKRQADIEVPNHSED